MINFKVKKEYLKEEISARHRNVGLVFITGYMVSRKHGKIAYILREGDREFTTLISDNLVNVVKLVPMIDKMRRKTGSLKVL